MLSGEEHTSDGRLIVGLLTAFVLIGALAALDLLSDVSEGITLGHALAEGGVVLLSLTGAMLLARRLVVLARGIRSARRELTKLSDRLAASEREAAHWRDEAGDLLRGLGVVIDRQFARWQLSPAEREVALLLLKGLSHKEIAQARDVTQTTARQQATAVYRKSKLSGRSELAAFFLEDLLLPQDEAGAAHDAKRG